MNGAEIPVKGMQNFFGQRLHMLQIGLGTFATFVQELHTYEEKNKCFLSWLLSAVTDNSLLIRAVGVEPREDYVSRLTPLMLKDLPNSSLVQAALVSQNMEVVMHMLTPGCSETSRNKVTPDLHEAYDTALTYLHNMSCIGQPHPYASKHIQSMKQEFEVDITIETAKVAGITYEALHDLLNFSGTVLLFN